LMTHLKLYWIRFSVSFKLLFYFLQLEQHFPINVSVFRPFFLVSISPHHSKDFTLVIFQYPSCLVSVLKLQFQISKEVEV